MKKEKLKNIIEDFEAGKINVDSAMKMIYEITFQSIDELRLKNYWRSESMEELISSLSYNEYKDWVNINEDKVIELLNEIRENIGDDSILNRNSEALERRYKKPSGTVVDFLFQSDYKNKEILRRLKIDTTTIL